LVFEGKKNQRREKMKTRSGVSRSDGKNQTGICCSGKIKNEKKKKKRKILPSQDKRDEFEKRKEGCCGLVQKKKKGIGLKDSPWENEQKSVKKKEKKGGGRATLQQKKKGKKGKLL